MAYIGITESFSCENSSFPRCKVRLSAYTDFTPIVRMNVMMRSIIGAVI
jgi:hypothetical protein